MKKNIKHITPALLAIVAFVALSFMPADSVTLRLKPQQGKTYTATSKANMMTMMEVQGQSMNMTQVMETRQAFTAKEVSDAQCVIETQMDALKMTISQMGMKLEYDSEHPEKTSPMLAGQVQELEKSLKNPMTTTYDAKGKFIESSDELEMSQLSNIILELPEEELSVGSTWSSEKEQSVSGTDIKVNMEYIVTAISKKSVDVDFSGTVESTEASGSYNGSASIDPKTGLVISSTTKSNLSMTVSEQGLSIPVTIIGTTTVEVK